MTAFPPATPPTRRSRRSCSATTPPRYRCSPRRRSPPRRTGSSRWPCTAGRAGPVPGRARRARRGRGGARAHPRAGRAAARAGAGLAAPAPPGRRGCPGDGPGRGLAGADRRGSRRGWPRAPTGTGAGAGIAGIGARAQARMGHAGRPLPCSPARPGASPGAGVGAELHADGVRGGRDALAARPPRPPRRRRVRVAGQGVAGRLPVPDDRRPPCAGPRCAPSWAGPTRRRGGSPRPAPCSTPRAPDRCGPWSTTTRR